MKLLVLLLDSQTGVLRTGNCYFGGGLKLPHFSITTGFFGFIKATLGSGVS